MIYLYKKFKMKNNRRKFLKISATGLGYMISSNVINMGCKKLNNNELIKNTADKNISPYDIWLWIELIGFDNTQKDYGVKNFINNTVFVPKAISFLFSSSDFVNSHQGMANEWVFPPEYCSYNGRPYSRLRNRQDWTNYQLRGLIGELQKYGIDVYCSFFDFFVNTDGEMRFGHQHPEIWETGVKGNRYPYIHPLKRLSDGSFYEDFFINKLSEVMNDYGFDGLHIADGIAHTRRPLSDVDYSDDMVEQFLNQTAVNLPDYLLGQLDDNENKYIQRSDWIWKNNKQEWINFHIERWESFYKKIVEYFHQNEKKVILNSAWTRAPFEAIYRYGIDYRRIANLSVDGFIIEAVASAVAMEPRLSDEHSKIHYIMMAMLMLIKAQAPGTPLMPFTGIHDTTEQYDALRHIPTVVEREIYSMANLFIYDNNGMPKRCSSGPMGCLSDALYSHEWQWLKQKWDLGFSSLPESVGGITLLWSDKIVENQVEDYIKTRRWSVHKLLYELMVLGAPVYSVCNINSIDNIKGPVLVLNPNLFPQNELDQVLDYSNGPIVIIGGKVILSESPEYQFEDVYPPDSLYCAVYNSKKNFEVQIKKESKEDIPVDFNEIPEPYSWTESLYYRKVSDSFIKACLSVISNCTDQPSILTESESIQVMTLKYSEKNYRLLIGNDSYYYETPRIEMKSKIEKITVKTSFPGVPVIFNNKEFRVRLPGKGMVILDIILV
jgi:hypothetical protein